ncbi:MAG: hypothetical protein FWE20_08595 [Defluviitaleaceae bacterium]|nr:hypothetical protein [Defluviitaleaceae bacterium]
MDEVKKNIITLDADGHKAFSGMAFDGCHIFATLPKEYAIYKFNPEFAAKGSYHTRRPYKAIAFDVREKCFWASAGSDVDKVYKLDRKLREVDRITLKIDKKEICSPIAGLSYDCENDALLVAYPEIVLEADKTSGSVRILRRLCEGRFLAVLSAAPYYAAAYRNNKKTEIQLLSREGRLVHTIAIPDGYRVQDMLLQPCKRGKHTKPEILTLVLKHGEYPSILRHGIREIELERCNYYVCKANCSDDDEKQCENDLIESIAMVEAALSHILNAEGEKLQKAVEIAGSTEDLLEVNKSVTKMIISATQLEYMLYLKLDALRGLREKTK